LFCEFKSTQIDITAGFLQRIQPLNGAWGLGPVVLTDRSAKVPAIRLARTLKVHAQA
jgi:hypothetical protein